MGHIIGLFYHSNILFGDSVNSATRLCRFFSPEYIIPVLLLLVPLFQLGLVHRGDNY